MRATTGSGDSTIAASNGFYVDDTVPEFDMDIMRGDFYFDVGQGESTPVKYQKSNDTIKCVWKCDDLESGIVVSSCASLKLRIYNSGFSIIGLKLTVKHLVL